MIRSLLDSFLRGMSFSAAATSILIAAEIAHRVQSILLFFLLVFPLCILFGLTIRHMLPIWK
jgi:hypothetical protein